MRRKLHPRLFALLASLLLHAGLLALLLSLRAPSLPAPPEPEPPVEIEILVTEPASPAPAGPEPLPGRSAAPVPAPGTGRSPPGPAPRTDAPATTLPGTSPGPSTDAQATAPVSAPIADRPARLSGGDVALAPTTKSAHGLGFDSLEGPGLGTTVRSGDPAPDPAAARQKEAREVGERVQGLLADAQARHRVTTGGVDDYFGKLRESLAEHAAKPPPGRRLSNPVGAAIDGWVGGLERYGATGNPYRAAEGRVKKQGEGLNAIDDKLRRSSDFYEGEFGSDMVAIVELWQAGDGGLLDWKLVASSGLPDFDDYVMGSVPQAVAALAPPPPEGAGLHADGIRSRWAFEGRIQYRTPLQGESHRETASNALFLVLGGTFEETTGEVWVNRVDKPQFLCKVRLLSVY